MRYPIARRGSSLAPVGTVLAVQNDATDLADEYDEYDEAEPDEGEDLDEQDVNGQVLSIRRASGEEVMTIVAQDDEWNVALQPGGTVQNAFLGSRRDSPVWISTFDHQIERDEDGTYYILID